MQFQIAPEYRAERQTLMDSIMDICSRYFSWIPFVQRRVYLIALIAALWKYGNECNRSWNLSMSTYERKVIFLRQ